MKDIFGESWDYEIAKINYFAIEAFLRPSLLTLYLNGEDAWQREVARYREATDKAFEKYERERDKLKLRGLLVDEAGS